jgi:hypothetical protein
MAVLSQSFQESKGNGEGWVTNLLGRSWLCPSGWHLSQGQQEKQDRRDSIGEGFMARRWLSELWGLAGQVQTYGAGSGYRLASQTW